MSELKPCPFCGGEAKRKYGRYNLLGAYGTREMDRRWDGVYCTCCGVSQPSRCYSAKEEAIEAWNTRADDTDINVGEIRAKAIDEFARALLKNEVVDKSVVRRVAEQMKGE